MRYRIKDDKFFKGLCNVLDRVLFFSALGALFYWALVNIPYYATSNFWRP